MTLSRKKTLIDINNTQFEDHSLGTSAQQWGVVAEVKKTRAGGRGAAQDLTDLA